LATEPYILLSDHFSDHLYPKEANIFHILLATMDKNWGLAVIILNWNNAVSTLECLSMISAWSGLKVEVIIVDNGSSEEDLSRLSGLNQGFALIKNKTNKGFAGGNNAGITFALEKGFSYIMLLNSDAMIQKQCIMKLLEYMNQDPIIGVLGPLIEEKGRVFAGGRNIGVYSNTRIPYKPENGDTAFREVDYVPGTVLLARGDAFRKAGLLDEEFFFSGEIADFCRRVRLSGLKCAVYQKCQAIHAPDNELTARETLYNYYTLRNRFLFVRNHFRYSKNIFILRWIAAGVMQILLARISGRRTRADALWLGLKDGISGRFGDRNDQFHR